MTTAQTNDSGNYDVIITNTFGSVTSSVAPVNVIHYAPTITLQPTGGNKLAGSDFTLTAAAAGTAPLFWQWMKDGSPLADATTPSYSVIAAETNDSGSYTVVVTNIAGGATSIVANVNVGYAPVIVQQPQTLTNFVGGTVEFSCTVTGTAPIHLQWLFNGNVLEGETNAALTLTNLQLRNIGFYALTATNAFGGTVSSNATLNLESYPFGIWEGLVAYYPFNGNANDVSGNGAHGTVNGATLSSNRFGLPDSAYSFNGTSAFIDCGNNSLFNFGQSDFTICAWIETSGAQINKYIVGKYSADVSGSYGLGTSGSTVPYAFLWDSESAAIAASGPTALNDSRWHQLIAVYERDSTLSIYRDGVLDGQVSVADTQGSISNSFPLLIGKIASGQHFAGKIDDIRIYNRALSTNEVAQLFFSEMPLPIIDQPQFNSGIFGFNLSGTLGEVVVEASDELEMWFPIATNILDGTPTFFTDPQSTNLPARFYRIRQ